MNERDPFFLRDTGELEKRQVGEVWAKTSGGKCLFLMAVKKDEAGRGVSAQLDAVISRS